MKTIRIIELKFGGKKYSLIFGTPTTDQELEEMFRLRYQIYVAETQYGDERFFPDGKEYDEYDLKKQCSYFTVTLDNQIVGTVRLIKSDPLPVIKDYFDFREPKEINRIPRENLVEISRLISRPRKLAVPRHLIMLGLFDCILKSPKSTDIEAGYAVIEKPLEEKLRRLKFPLHAIDGFSLKTSPLTQKFTGYFSRNNDLYLIYFLKDEVEEYINKALNNKCFFRKKDEQTLIFKKGFCYKLVKLFSKISI